MSKLFPFLNIQLQLNMYQFGSIIAHLSIRRLIINKLFKIQFILFLSLLNLKVYAEESTSKSCNYTILTGINLIKNENGSTDRLNGLIQFLMARRGYKYDVSSQNLLGSTSFGFSGASNGGDGGGSGVREINLDNISEFYGTLAILKSSNSNPVNYANVDFNNPIWESDKIEVTKKESARFIMHSDSSNILKQGKFNMIEIFIIKALSSVPNCE